MATTNKIMVGIDDQIIELSGKAKEDFIKDREESNARIALLETEYKEKQKVNKGGMINI